MTIAGRLLLRRRPIQAEPTPGGPEVLGSLDLSGAIARAAAERLDWPHVVVYLDHATVCTNAAGPFADVVEACGFAGRIGDELGSNGGVGVTVVPLHAADR